VAVDGGFVLPGQTSFELLPNSGRAATALTWPVSSGHTHLLRAGPRSVWSITEQPDGIQAVERELDGDGTGRKVVVPLGTYVAASLDGALVVSSHGSLTLVDAGTGGRRALGTGDVVAARGRTVARQSCALLRCRVELVDTVSGRTRLVAGLADVDGYLGRGAFSPDGRWLAFAVSASRSEQVTVVDTTGGQTWSAAATDSPVPFTFSPDSRVLFSVNAGQVCARVLATGDQHCLKGLGSSGAQEIVATAAG
jgi:hypothetical protein